MNDLETFEKFKNSIKHLRFKRTPSKPKSERLQKLLNEFELYTPKRRRIKTTKDYTVYIDLPKGMTEDEFKESIKYRKMLKFIMNNNLILYNQMFVVNYDEEEEYNIPENCNSCVFSFLVKKDVVLVSKEFDLQIYSDDSDGLYYHYWPNEDDESFGDPWLPPGMDYDMCMEIYGDIPGDRG